MKREILACSDAATMRFVFSNAEVVLVRYGFHAIVSEFPQNISDLIAVRRPRVQLAVMDYDANRDLEFKLELGELAACASGKLVGKFHPDEPKSEMWARIYDGKKAEEHRARVERLVLELVDRAGAQASTVQAPANDTPFATLGVPETASMVDVEAVRKRLVLEVHPDRAGNLGPRGIKLLEEETKKINGAVDAIRRMRSAGKR